MLELGVLSYEVTLPINRHLPFVVHTYNEIIEKLSLSPPIVFLFLVSFFSNTLSARYSRTKKKKKKVTLTVQRDKPTQDPSYLSLCLEKHVTTSTFLPFSCLLLLIVARRQQVASRLACVASNGPIEKNKKGGDLQGTICKEFSFGRVSRIFDWPKLPHPTSDRLTVWFYGFVATRITE